MSCKILVFIGCALFASGARAQVDSATSPCDTTTTEEATEDPRAAEVNAAMEKYTNYFCDLGNIFPVNLSKSQETHIASVGTLCCSPLSVHSLLSNNLSHQKVNYLQRGT